MITLFEKYDIITSTNRDIRYVITLHFNDDIYVNCYSNISNGYVKINDITDMNYVIKYFPSQIEQEINNVKDDLISYVNYKIEVLTIDELELQVTANKYNL